MLNNLIKDGFSERIYPVNPKEDEILKGINGHQ
jgi:acyl-CoA synthetase (NDP forming)